MTDIQKLNEHENKPTGRFIENLRRFFEHKAYEIRAESLATLSFLDHNKSNYYLSLRGNQTLDLNKIYSNAFLRFTFANDAINEYIHTTVTTKASKKLHYLFTVNTFAMEDMNLRAYRLQVDNNGNQLVRSSTYNAISTFTGRPQKFPITHLDIHQIPSHDLQISPLTQSVSDFLLNLAEA